MKRETYELEICANSIQSVIAAEQGGANRVELCDNLYEGGTTPSAGAIYLAKEKTNIDLFSIIRPRGGDFLYSKEEVNIMIKDIEVSRLMGADGIVIGCLTPKGKVDYETCARLVEASKGLPVNFHRAFDMTVDAFEAMETIQQLGIQRILTAGQKNKAIEGLTFIAQLVEKAGNKIKIMAGSGLDEHNIVEIAQATKAVAFHAAIRMPYESKMVFRRDSIFMGGLPTIPEFTNFYTSSERVRNLIQKLELL